MKQLLFLVTLFFNINAQAQSRYTLMPWPQHLEARDGDFTINAKTVLIADARLFKNEIAQLKSVTKQSLQLSKNRNAVNAIILTLDPAITNDEGYKLDITNQRIQLSGKDQTSIFRGIETLRQLLPVSLEQSLKATPAKVPAVYIDDYPEYAYRGMHMDVSRHFFTMEYIKKFIDRLALYKFNKFHFHLTDDQGWRVEIKKYPLLTQKGSWRTFNEQDSACMQAAAATGNADMNIDTRFIKTIDGKKMYGGFYTQAQLRDLVKYAAARHIDIIPEIDMPGHMDAAIQLYPYLSCTEGGWKGGPFTVPICPCKESVFEFAENIYKEIFDIFPYEYVHLGADEVNKDSWKNFSGCKEVMEREHIKTVEELQSYFVHRMEKFFNAHGKKLIGWDEILEGGVSPTANVMYWRSWVPKAPVEAAKNGNKVIMTPGNPLYFDAVPDKNSLKNVFFFNPIPKGLTDAQAKNIIGAQANSWSEYIPTEARHEYMTLPRMLALGEVLWNSHNKDFKEFQQRLLQQTNRLDALKTRYRLPDIDDMVEENVFIQSAEFYPKAAPGTVLRYTTNGRQPDASSPIFDKPALVTQTTQFKVAAFKGTLRGDVYTANYKQQNPLPAVKVKRARSGLSVNLFTGNFKRTAGLNTKKATDNWVQDGWEPDVARLKGIGSFGLTYNGVIAVPEDGVYTFYLTADDGAILNIDNQLVVDNDGLHSAKEKSGQVALQQGQHLFEIKFIEGGGGYALHLEVKTPSGKRMPVPDTWFK